MAIELETKVNWFQDAAKASMYARQLAERDRDYYDNKQWTEEEERELKKRKQAPIVINRVAPKVDFLLGVERQNRVDPKAFPRTPDDEDSAEAATDAIRYVVDKNNFDCISSDVFENLAIEGIGGAAVEAKDRGKEIEILVKYFFWDRFFYDPHSRMRDFSDSRYMGIVIWKDFDEVKNRFPDSAEALDNLLADVAGAGDTYDDKPTYKQWIDATRRRVMCVQMFYQEDGRWQHAIFTRGTYLRSPEDSPYVDEDGEPENPLIAQSTKVDREGNRYGAVRQLIGPQDEINKRRSKALHLLSTRQTWGEKGAVDNIAAAKRELAKPDGHVETTPNMKFELLNTSDMAAGQFQLLQEAKSEIDTIGANAFLDGTQAANSGRQQQMMQQGGMIELGPLFDAHRMWKKRIYQAIWSRIKQFWDEEKWVRVTDDENNLKFVGLNQPQTVGEALQEVAQNEKADPQKRQLAQQTLQAMLASQDPRLNQVHKIKNNVSEMDVDIIIDEVPDTVNLQSEQFDQLVKMYAANPGGIPWEMIVEMSSLRKKDRILEGMAGNKEQQAQMNAMQQQLAQIAAKLDLESKQLDNVHKQAEIQKTQAEAQQTQLENVIAQAFPDVKPNVNI